MIKQIIKCLNENPKVSDWLINETETESYQAFYVLQNLETTREVKTTEYSITIYHRFSENDNEYVGSSTFVINHKLNKSKLAQKIEDAVYAASFVKNKPYQLVKGDKKKSWKEKDYQFQPFEIIDKIANIFIQEAKFHVKFNAMEVFLTKLTNHIINSQGVNLKKTLNKINVEAIPSYDGEEEKVELYKYFTYANLDFDIIQEDAINALKDVTIRYNAKKLGDLKKVDIIFKNQELVTFFTTLIEDYSYVSVYKQNTDKKIGDMIQENVNMDLLTINYIPNSKADAFDKDGVILKPTTIIEEGKLVSFFGDNQYAQYLGLEPSGIMNTIKVEKGKLSVQKITKKPYLEIIALSGLQIETFNDYIGGEVRLAIYFDGHEYYPLSGFSFSGSIKNCLSNIVLSKETININRYQGPKMIKIHGMDIL